MARFEMKYRRACLAVAMMALVTIPASAQPANAPSVPSPEVPAEKKPVVTPSAPSDTKPQTEPAPAQEAAADPFAKGNRWEGLDADKRKHTIRVTERSESEKTAKLFINKEGEGDITLELKFEGSRWRVERATRKVEKNIAVGKDPNFTITVDKNDVLRISGQCMFNAPKAQVQNKVFTLSIECKPIEPKKKKKRGK
jgi:hypothetical protein